MATKQRRESDWLKSSGRMEEESRPAGPTQLESGFDTFNPPVEIAARDGPLTQRCVRVSVHPCCFQTDVKRSIREGYKFPPTGTGQSQWP